MAAVAEDDIISRKRQTSPKMSCMIQEEVESEEWSSKKSKIDSHKRNPEQPDSTSKALSIDELEKVSGALGLRKDFLNEMMSIPEDILWHKGIEGFVLNFIEGAYFDIEEQPLKEKISEELLKQIGFTDSEVVKTILARSEKMKHHLDAIDFIKRFVKDEFKYNSNLTDYATEDEDIADDAEELQFSHYRIRKLRRCHEVFCRGFIPHYLEVHHFPYYRNHEQNEHCEFFRLFHGTDLYSAFDIMENGIEPDFGRHKHDFSDGGGFYLTTQFEHAKTWACSQTRKPVVLELKIPRICLKEARALKLDVSRRRGRSEWDRVVSEHRSGRPSKKLRQEMKEYDCIEGPISVPSQDPDDSTRFRPDPGSYQLCVVKRSFAEEIEKNAKYTLYTEALE